MSLVPELDHPEDECPRPYRRLLDALHRLLDGTPQSPELAEQMEDADGSHKPLITQTNVAIEAGSPSLRKYISGEKCKYPRMAAFIVSLRSTHGVSEGTLEKIRRQAELIARYEQKVRVLRSKVLDAIREKDEALQALADERSRARRKAD